MFFGVNVIRLRFQLEDVMAWAMAHSVAFSLIFL